MQNQEDLTAAWEDILGDLGDADHSRSWTTPEFARSQEFRQQIEDFLRKSGVIR